MAMTASIALSNSTPGINEPIVATVTISNSSGSSVSLTSLSPYTTPVGSALISDPALPLQPITVPGSGSALVSFRVVFSSAGTYAVGASLSSSDGSNFSASTASATVPIYSSSAPSAPSLASAITSLTGDGTASGPGAAALAIPAIDAATASNTASTLMLRSALGHSALGVLEMASASISDKATGGSIGSAATTVDIASVALCNQTTAAQTLTLPSPTAAAPIRAMYVMNIGSQDFTMLSKTVTAGTGILAIWTGAAWSFVA